MVALQEVDVRFGARSQFVNQVEVLRQSLGGQVAFGANLVEGQGQYGVALISRFPILEQRNLPLPRSEGRELAEPRGLLETTLNIEGRKVRVYVTHLAHDSASDRKLQVDRIREIVSAGGPVRPCSWATSTSAPTRATTATSSTRSPPPRPTHRPEIS